MKHRHSVQRVPSTPVKRCFTPVRRMRMKRKIVGYERDAENYWVAVLDCGHTVHLRHQPPWQDRSWTLTEEGRTRYLGFELDCARCEAEQGVNSA